MYSGIAITSVLILIQALATFGIVFCFGDTKIGLGLVFLLLVSMYHSWCFNHANILGMKKYYYQVTNSIKSFILLQLFLILIFAIGYHANLTGLSFQESLVTSLFGYIGTFEVSGEIISKVNALIIAQGIIFILNIPILIWLFTTYIEWRIEHLDEMQKHNRKLVSEANFSNAQDIIKSESEKH